MVCREKLFEALKRLDLYLKIKTGDIEITTMAILIESGLFVFYREWDTP